MKKAILFLLLNFQFLASDWPMFMTVKDSSYLYYMSVAAGGFEDVTLNRQISIEPSPVDLVVAPNGKYVYLLYTQQKSLLPIDVSQDKTIFCPPISVGKRGTDMAISPDGNSIYVISNTDNSLNILSLSSNIVLTNSSTVDLNGKPQILVFSLDGSKVFIGCTGVIDKKNTGFITTFNTASQKVVSQVALTDSPCSPFAMVVNPQNSKVYILATQDKVKNQSLLFVLDVQSSQPSVVASLPISCTSAARMTISPKGDSLYITNKESGLLYTIDTTSSLYISSSFYVGQSPVTVTVTPDGSTLYVPLAEDKIIVPLRMDRTGYVIGDPILRNIVPELVAMSPDIAPTAFFTVQDPIVTRVAD